MHWNVWYREDIRKIADYLGTLEADVICLSELTRNHPDSTVKDGPEFIAGTLGMNHVACYMPLDEHNAAGGEMANGVFTKHTITDTRTVGINEPTGTGGYDDENRAYVEATIRIGNQLIRVGTTHMSYTHRFEDTARKRQEADRLCAAIAQPGPPLVVTGDLNAGADSYTVQQIGGLLVPVSGLAGKPTWTTQPFSYGGFEENKLAWTLDYMFTSPDVNVNKAETLNPGLSDHLLLIADIALCPHVPG